MMVHHYVNFGKKNDENELQIMIEISSTSVIKIEILYVSSHLHQT